MKTTFNYADAFSRNLGWVADHEQQILRQKTVAIAGMGGVGGIHLLTLARVGLGGFHIADFDRFELPNFNRQSGAAWSTLGQPKVEVLERMARDINPELRIRRFDTGVTPSNVADFLAGVDIYVDGLDFFAFAARKLLFAECARRGIPAITVAPVGMGAALLVFMPGKMTFEEYFQWEGQDEEEMAVRFLVGLAPASLHRNYLVDDSYVDFIARRTPSTGIACQLAAGIASAETLKILLQRGPVRAAPAGMQFDAYTLRIARTWRPGGNRHPLQRLILWLARRQLAAMRTRRTQAIAS